MNTVSIGVIGNCQAEGIADALLALADINVDHYSLASVRNNPSTYSAILDRQYDFHLVLQLAKSVDFPRTIPIPALSFAGWHPDCVLARDSNGRQISGEALVGSCHSALAIWAFRQGLSIDAAVSLFCEEVYAHLGYFDALPFWIKFFDEQARKSGLAPIKVEGPEWHMPLHPKPAVFMAAAHVLIERLGLSVTRDGSVEDKLERQGAWPLYPSLAARHGLSCGDYAFRGKQFSSDLEGFVKASFDLYRVNPVTCTAIEDPRFEQLMQFVA